MHPIKKKYSPQSDSEDNDDNIADEKNGNEFALGICEVDADTGFEFDSTAEN